MSHAFPSYHIRDEVPGDTAAVAAVLAAAFEEASSRQASSGQASSGQASSGQPGVCQPTEVALVADLRAAGALALSLVAEASDGTVVGHVAFSPVTVDAQGGGEGPDSGRLLGLAPLAVLPAWQGRGVGIALVKAGLARARATGAELVFVLGDPAYYRRFGFRPAGERGIAWEHEAPAEAVMALALDPGDPGGGPARCGVLRYHPTFDRFAD